MGGIIQMTSKEILHKIVESEKNARLIYDETVALQNGFDDYIKLHINELKKKYTNEAEKEIKEFDTEEKKKADNEIKRLDDKLEANLTKAKKHYESEKSNIVNKLFNVAVNGNA